MTNREMAEWIYIGLFLLATIGESEEETDVEDLAAVAWLAAQTWGSADNARTFDTEEASA